MIGNIVLSFLVLMSPLVGMAFYKIYKLNRETTKAEQNPRPFEPAPSRTRWPFSVISPSPSVSSSSSRSRRQPSSSPLAHGS